MSKKLLFSLFLLVSAAQASRNISGTDYLAGPTTAFGSTGSLHFKEQHSWSQGDSNAHVLFEIMIDASNYLQLVKNAANQIVFNRNTAGVLNNVSCSSGTYTLNTGSMNTFTVSWNNFSNAAIYLNATNCVTNFSGTAAGLASGTAWAIGNRPSTGIVPWTGDIWDIGAWSTQLSSGNATTLNSCGTHPGAIPTGLVQEWDLVGSSLLSQSGGSALTATGTTVSSTCNDPTGSLGVGSVIH